MRIAIKEKNTGARYVAFGAIGTSVFLLVNRMINADIISLSTSLYYLDLILLYISFPLGIYISPISMVAFLLIWRKRSENELTNLMS
jgi:nitrate reductase gamma subunit